MRGRCNGGRSIPGAHCLWWSNMARLQRRQKCLLRGVLSVCHHRPSLLLPLKATDTSFAWCTHCFLCCLSRDYPVVAQNRSLRTPDASTAAAAALHGGDTTAAADALSSHPLHSSRSVASSYATTAQSDYSSNFLTPRQLLHALLQQQQQEPPPQPAQPQLPPVPESDGGAEEPPQFWEARPLAYPSDYWSNSRVVRKHGDLTVQH